MPIKRFVTRTKPYVREKTTVKEEEDFLVMGSGKTLRKKADKKKKEVRTGIELARGNERFERCGVPCVLP